MPTFSYRACLATKVYRIHVSRHATLRPPLHWNPAYHVFTFCKIYDFLIKNRRRLPYFAHCLPSIACFLLPYRRPHFQRPSPLCICSSMACCQRLQRWMPPISYAAWCLTIAGACIPIPLSSSTTMVTCWRGLMFSMTNKACGRPGFSVPIRSMHNGFPHVPNFSVWCGPSERSRGHGQISWSKARKEKLVFVTSRGGIPCSLKVGRPLWARSIAV